MPDLDFLIAEFQERDLPDSTPRVLSLPQIPRKAAVVVGMRRTGTLVPTRSPLNAASKSSR